MSGARFFQQPQQRNVFNQGNKATIQQTPLMKKEKNLSNVVGCVDQSRRICTDCCTISISTAGTMRFPQQQTPNFSSPGQGQGLMGRAPQQQQQQAGGLLSNLHQQVCVCARVCVCVTDHVSILACVRAEEDLKRHDVRQVGVSLW